MKYDSIYKKTNVGTDAAALLRGSHGFTLPELLVAMVIGMIVIGALVTTYQKFVSSVTTQNVSADLQLGGRAALEFMVREIRMAGYTQSTPDKASFGIQEAQSSKIRFTWDQMNPPDPLAGVGEVENNKEEIITYYFDPADSSVKRQLNESTVNMSRQPLLGGIDGQLQISNLDFTYLDGNENTLSNPNSNLSLIRSIIITLTAQAPAGSAGMISRTFVSRVRCRNLGL